MRISNPILSAQTFLRLACSITLLLTSTTAIANIFNKTHITTRAHGTNYALLEGAGINETIYRQDCIEKFGGTVQAVTWFSSGDMKSKHWAPVNKDVFKLGTAGANIDISTADFDARRLVLSLKSAGPNDAETETGAIKFSPEQKSYGIVFAYDHRLDNIINGLYFKVMFPFVYVENNLNSLISGTSANALKKYFAGTFKDITPATLQDPLTYARIDGGGSSATGIGDVDALMGFVFYDNGSRRATFNIGVTLPTGTQLTGEKLFEAVVGNHRHFALGGGFTLDQKLWGDQNENVSMHSMINFRYLLESAEMRTVGIQGEPFGHYNLLAPLDNQGRHLPNKALVPAANVLTTDVLVTPGTMLDSILSFVYNKGNFSVLAGYNFFAKETEVLRMTRNPLETMTYDDQVGYGLIKQSFAVNAAATAAHIREASSGRTVLTQDDLDLSTPKTFSHTTHKIFGNVAWTFKSWDTFCNIGVGAHYEIANGTKAIDNWGVNFNVGLSL